ncbi:MAG: hypothetical protein KatS3mg053_3185 [Candidatus Roseilinea sp.]|jgi:hypothetical protein|nr:MAG: hypothetical protein KatS3mg053_3185 [Candidatus Roseilinea sp.]
MNRLRTPDRPIEFTNWARTAVSRPAAGCEVK